MVGTEDDITYRKTAADKMAQMEHKLTHVARLSTLGELVAGIAHEVNQPLYAIVNFAKASRNLLSQSDQPDLEMLRDWNEQISEAAVRGGAIIKRLRDFVSRGQPRRAAASANALIRETCGLMEFSLRQSDARVELELAEPLPAVIVDSLQIQQVLVNLLQNACEAMADAAVDNRRIVVRTGKLNDRVSITVADNGPGLPQDSGLNVFDSFVTTKPEGLGMGLAISRTIVEAHGGRLWAAAAKGGGAEFLFTLPTEANHDGDDD
jgi:C4-dicarboxylate-specific signal transduction histidine kinase